MGRNEALSDTSPDLIARGAHRWKRLRIKSHRRIAAKVLSAYCERLLGIADDAGARGVVCATAGRE
jgi:hypothetical protein